MSRMFKIAKQAIHLSSRYACMTGMLVLLLMMLLTTADVIGRSFLKLPIPGAFEIAQYMLVVCILLGIAYTQQVEGHVRISILSSRWHLQTQLAIDSILTLASLFVFSLIIWRGWVEAGIALQVGAVSDVLRIPQWPFRLFISVGCFLLCLELLIRVITSAKRLCEKGIGNKVTTP